ncbi:hypothetical protein TNCV_1404821 [Trichonephila clavipes]|nr:hypothetical protein TNCV_1404821 [Trichonephila clavipes]
MTPAYDRRGVLLPIRDESITGESPTSFPDDGTTMTYSGFKPEPTRLQAEGHSHHTGWVENIAVVASIRFHFYTSMRREAILYAREKKRIQKSHKNSPHLCQMGQIGPVAHFCVLAFYQI